MKKYLSDSKRLFGLLAAGGAVIQLVYIWLYAGLKSVSSPNLPLSGVGAIGIILFVVSLLVLVVKLPRLNKLIPIAILICYGLGLALMWNKDAPQLHDLWRAQVALHQPSTFEGTVDSSRRGCYVDNGDCSIEVDGRTIITDCSGFITDDLKCPRDGLNNASVDYKDGDMVKVTAVWLHDHTYSLYCDSCDVQVMHQ